MLNIEAYVLAKKYTDKSIQGAGGLKGAPCQVESVVPISGGTRVTLSWTDDSGNKETDSFDVMNGISPTISQETGNALEQKADGWYVADVQGVEISHFANNILEQKQDGLYVTAVQSVTNGTTDGTIKVDDVPITIFEIASQSDIDDLFN